MSDRPYTNEELAAALLAAKDFVDSLGEAGQYVGPRDLAHFDAGFKIGRRTPGPATAEVRDMLASQPTAKVHVLMLTPSHRDRLLAEWS